MKGEHPRDHEFSATPLLVRGRRWHDVFGKLARRRSMHHRVSVLNADTVSTTMRLYDVHHRIVCIFFRPIALPLEHHHERRDGFGTGLDHALHGVLVRQLAHVAAAVFDDIDFTHSTGFSGDAPILSQYACYFNRLPARCLIRTNRHPMGDETWHRPPKHLAKTAPSPSISTMRPPTRSSLATPRRSSSLSWPSSSPSASS